MPRGAAGREQHESLQLSQDTNPEPAALLSSKITGTGLQSKWQSQRIAKKQQGGDLRKTQIKDNFSFKDYFELWQMQKFVDDSKFVSLRMVTHQATDLQIPDRQNTIN